MASYGELLWHVSNAVWFLFFGFCFSWNSMTTSTSPCQEADHVYAEACSQFNKSGLLHMFIAQYVKVFRPFLRLEKCHLLAAEVW